MGNTSNRRNSADTNQTLPSRHPLAMACAAAFMIAASASHAQEAATTAPQTDEEKAAAAAAAKRRGEPAKELETVKVTGIRRGIENAIETKQSASGIVESISAEDIGKLPDSSIAESIARLPGLTAQRERGRATQINIRGFAGDFAGTTLNGREQTSTSDNRGVEFDQYPSELLSGVTVYKTPDASLVGQGLSGTVDLKTVRPLAFAERVMSVNFRGDQNKGNGQKEYGNRYSFSYIDQFLDRTVGLAIGYAHLDSPSSGFQNEAWGYPSERWTGTQNVPAIPTNPGVNIFGGANVFRIDSNQKRDGLMATLQFKPNDFYETSLDLFYSKFKKTEVKTGVGFGTTWGTPSLTPTSVTINGDTATSSSWTGVIPVLRMDSNPIDDKLQSIGWNNKWKVNDNWSINADLSRSETTRKFRVLETYAGIKSKTTTLGVELDPSGDFNNYVFGTDFNDPNNLQLIDAGGWGQDGYLKDFETNDKLTAFRLDANRSFDEGAISSIAFGFNRTDRTKDRSASEAKLCIVACVTSALNSAPFPGTAGVFGIGGIEGLASYDANDLLNSGFYNLLTNFHKDIAGKNWEVNESIDTFYVQANLDTDIGSNVLRGNFGFQYVRADQDSTGFSTFSGNAAGTTTTAGDKYSNFLPSMNLSLEMPNDQYLRFALAKQMARPRLDDMKVSFDVNICNNCGGLAGNTWKGSGGNPALRPWLANAIDLSYEKYFTDDFGNKGYVAAAYFYKDLKSFIYRADQPFDFAGYPLPAPTPGQLNYPATTTGTMNQPQNGTGGTMKGLELSASVPFGILWAPLNGFGAQLSYSDTRSAIPVACSTADNNENQGFCFEGSAPLPGLSKFTSNATLYYEKHGFSFRYSQRSRSRFRGEVLGFAGNKRYIDINGEKVQDAQVNYNFGEDSMLKGLSLYLQVSNIGDAPFTTSDGGDPDQRPTQYFEYGRTTLLGFSYKF